jgi:hypothetical protein
MGLPQWLWFMLPMFDAISIGTIQYEERRSPLQKDPQPSAFNVMRSGRTLGKRHLSLNPRPANLETAA